MLSFVVRHKYFFSLFLICLAAFAIRIHRLDVRSIWIDETFTLFEATAQGPEVCALLNSESRRVISVINAMPAREYKKLMKYNPLKSVKDCLVSFIESDTQPPLYYLTVHFWMKLFADSLFSIRFFSVLFGTGAIIMAYLFTARIFERSSGIFAAIFVAFSPFFVFFSQEARNYSMILFIILLNGYFFVRFKDEQKNSLMAGYIITTVSGLLVHYFYPLVLLGQIFYVLFFGRLDTGSRNKFCISFLIIILLISPWALAVALHGYNYSMTEWIFGFHRTLLDSFRDALSTFLSLFAAPYDYLELKYSILILLLLLSRFLFNPRSRNNLVMICVIFSVPLFFLFALDLFEKAFTLTIPRYYMLTFAGTIPLMGYLFNCGWRQKGYRIVVVLMVALMFIGAIVTVNGRAWQEISGPRVKEACLWINSQSFGKKVAVITDNFRASVLPDAYYLNDDILIVPVGSAQGLKKGFEDIRGKFDLVFVVQHTFNKIFCEPLTTWYKEVGSPGFKMIEEREFGPRAVLLRKFQP